MLEDGKTQRSISKKEVIEAFAKKNLTAKTSTEHIGTGTKITVDENSDEYTVIVYGDVDCDGYVDTFDAQEVVDYYINGGKGLSEVCKIAANVDNDTEDIDSFDAQRIIDFYIGIETKLVGEEPEANPDPGTDPTPGDKEKPTITIGQPVISVKFGEKYQLNDNDITANDNVDGDISNKVVREKIEFLPAGSSNRETVTSIDTNRIGDYTVTYKVSDSSNNTETATRRITVKGLDNIKVGNGNQVLNLSTLNLYITKPTTSTEIVENDPTDNNVYTIIPVTFYDQNGTPIDVVAANIQENLASMIDGKANIDLSATNQTVITKYYDIDGNPVAKNNTTTPIKQIGFAMALQGQNKTPDISKLDGKEIIFKCRNQEIKLPITVKYKTLQNLDLNTTTDVTTIGKDKTDTYVARMDEEFTLGIVEVGELEQPITKKMIENSEISFENNSYDSEKIMLWYELDDQGRVLLKGRIKGEGVYSIRPVVGNVKSNTVVSVTGIEVAKDLNISIGDDDEVTIKLVGENDDDESIFSWEDFVVNSAEGPQDIQLKDITCVQKGPVENQKYLNIDFANEKGESLDPNTEQANEIVRQIFVIVSEDAAITEDQLPIDVMVTITIFDGLKGITTSKTVVVHIV
ncbi:MAG: DUF5011 domain-containing protein [Clostridia bacterium]|nr:DUF5011 domain-containing protein [Clostridia bacterium]MCI9413252.1 DUF5011 domain-containing protein [Clostridia bacterium]